MFNFNRHKDHRARPLTADERDLRDRRHWRNDLAAEVRDDNGGIDLPSSFVGSLVAIAMLGLLSALAGAFIDEVSLDAFTDSNREAQLAGAAAGALAILLAFFAGGWTAARSARYSGVLNSIAVVIWTLVIAAAFSGLGYLVASDEPLLRDQLPNWLTDKDFSEEAALSAAVGLGLMLLGAIMGGLKGASYHRRLDRQLMAEPEDMEKIDVDGHDDDHDHPHDHPQTKRVYVEPLHSESADAHANNGTAADTGDDVIIERHNADGDEVAINRHEADGEDMIVERRDATDETYRPRE